MIRRLFFELLYLLRRSRWDTGISPPELMEYLRDASPGRAMDLGCGTGTNSITMARHGWNVVGVDFSSQAIRTARRKASSTSLSIEFLQDDVTRLKGVHGSFDLILDIGCFHTLSFAARGRYKENINNFLAPEGTFLLYTHTDRISDETTTQPPADQICHFFEDICRCIHVDSGTDSESHNRSAWFTMRRAS